MKSFEDEKAALARAGCRKGNSTFYVSKDFTSESTDGQSQKPKGASAERHSFLQYALLNFRDGIERYNESGSIGGSLRGTVRLLEYLKVKKLKKDKHINWTWKEVTDMVKYSPFPIITSLLKLETDYLNRLAVDSFTAIMRYMGDLPLSSQQRKVECVYTLLVICHHHPELRDELYCQLMKQTTNNKSLNPDSCNLGWRLLAYITAFFKCSESLMPYLVKYLETAAQDYRRSEQGTAEICLQNLKQTLKYGGRRNVPTEDEVELVTAGEMNKLQAYFLPGGVQQFLPTSASSVVRDITERLCNKLGICSGPEFNEFSLYCIVEGDSYTMPLENDEYILDLVAELKRNDSTFYLIFCRSVWYFPLRLNSELYIDIIYHQVIPDYLEGFLLVTSSATSCLPSQTVVEIARIAALLHRSDGMNYSPSEAEVIYLLPKPVLNLKHHTKIEWSEEVGKQWGDMTALTVTEAKAQTLDILQKWPLFGSCFFGIKIVASNSKESDNILAVNKAGINILDIETHETLWRFSFSSVHPSYNSEDTSFTDIELGDDTFRKCIRLQVDHAHELSRLMKQYQEIRHQTTDDEDDGQAEYPQVMIKV